MNCDANLPDFLNINQFISLENMRLLVLGAGGMLGNALIRYFDSSSGVSVFGTLRSEIPDFYINNVSMCTLYPYIDVEKEDDLLSVFDKVQPGVVINAVGLIKQLNASSDPLASIPINTLFPHKLAKICSLDGVRLIHLSTDCVFSGFKGMYTEDDATDASDLYGRSKLLGEVDYPHAITIRTSMIGHEISANRSLVEWFLSQNSKVKGYRHAIFSGLPTVEIARVIMDYILTHPELRGVYHVSADPISKFELLQKISHEYSKSIEIIPDDTLVIDRSLDSSRFRAATGFVPKSWDEMITTMREFG